MGKWTKTAGLLFLAAASVYSSQVIAEAAEKRAKSGIQVAAAVNPQAGESRIETAAAPAPVFFAPDTESSVRVLDDSADPFATDTASESTTDTASATDAVASTSDSTDAASTDASSTDAAADGATTQPSEGRSVSSSEVSMSDAGTVEIHVNDANLVEVLRMLSLQTQKNIVASKDVHGTVTANLYDVTVREALDAILHANGYAYREKGNFIYVYTAKEIAEIEKNERQMTTHVFRVYYTPALNAANMIKPVLSKEGGEVAITTPSKAGISNNPSGGAGNDHASDEIIVVTDYPENIEAARKILAEVDRRPQQILLEATILRATLNEDNALGVDFNIMGGVDLAGVVNGGPQIVNSGVNKPVAVDPATGLPGDPSVLGPGGVLPANQRTHSVGTGNAFTAPIANGLKVGWVTDSVSLFLSALEQVTDTTVLANPKVLALNRQQGEVFVGNEDGYYTTIITETTSSQSVESLKTGTRLIFRPFIGSDGYIRMEVHPEDSDGSVKANGLPSKTTTEVTSNIMVKDGHTIVIGGLFRESSVSGKSQVPFLGNIPLAGHLFKSQRDRTVREEVIILLTPHIVKDDAAYSRLSEEELKHAENLRVGVRKGMMPWGRERLAEGYYEAAKRELNKDNPDRQLAKWHLDAATNLNPKFTEAIDLKEEITSHQVTAVDASSIRGFVRRAMLHDVPPATQPTAEVPSTQPSDATAEAPSTQPSDATAEAPTTQPSETETADLSPAMVGTADGSVSDEGSAPSESDQNEQVEATSPVASEESDTEGESTTVEVSVEEVMDEPVTEEVPTEETTTDEVMTEEQGAAEPSTEGDEVAATEAESSEQSDESSSQESSADQDTAITVIPLDEVPATESGTDEQH